MLRTLFLACGLFAANLAQAANPQVEFKTNQGVIVLELSPEAAPATVDNFLQYVKAGQYNGLIFHRVIPGFMIQGGGFDASMNEKPTRAPIKNEAEAALKKGVRNTPGSISMARTMDPHSASAQFFINLVDNRMLDFPSRDGWGYAAFGHVIKGMEVVQGIAQVQTGSYGMHRDVPVKPVVIESARVLPDTK